MSILTFRIPPPPPTKRGLVGGSLENYHIAGKFQDLDFFNLWALRFIFRGLTLWHKIITYEKLFWNNCFGGITNFIRNSLKIQGPLNGGFQTGGFPNLDLSFPFCPFWDFPDFSGIFPICSGMVRGFSRFVLFLFLGLLRAPTRNIPKRVRDTIWTFPEKSGKDPGLETPRFSFSQKMSSCPGDCEGANPSRIPKQISGNNFRNTPRHKTNTCRKTILGN